MRKFLVTRRQEFSEVLNDFLQAVQRGDRPWSVAQLAALCIKRGSQEAYTSKWLYACAEGELDLPARVVGPLTRATGNTSLIELLCLECGGSFTPQEQTTFEQLTQASLPKAVKEVGDFIAGAGAALQAGALDRETILTLRRELAEMITACNALMAQIQAGPTNVHRMDRHAQM